MNDDLIELFNTNRELGKRIIDSLPTAIYVTDVDGWIRHFNSAAVEFSGRQPQPGNDRWCVSWKLFYPDGTPMPPDESSMAVALKEDRSIDGVEGIAKRPDGGSRWFKAYPSPLHNKGGEVIGGINMLVDISEQKKAEQTLRRSEEKYRALFESIDEGFCIIKVEFDEHEEPVDFRFLEANSSLEEHTGLKDVEGKYVSEVVPDLEEDWFEIYGKVALTGEPVRYKHYSEEMQRWFDEYAFRIGGPEERKVALLFKDITEQKKIQEERKQLLREVKTERERLADIFQQAPSFMCVLRGPDHVFERANDLYMKVVGENRDIIGKPAGEALPEAAGQGFIDLLDEVYETGEPFVGTDMPVVLQRQPDADPETRYLDFVYQPLRDTDGAINGIFVQGVDLTERRKAKEELKAMNETLEERVEERTQALLSYQDQLRSLASELSRAEERERQRLASGLHDNLGQLLAVGKMKVDLLQADQFSDHSSSDIDKLEAVMDDAISYTRNLMTELKPPPSLDEEDLLAKIEWVAKKMKKHDLEVIIEDDTRPKPLSKEVQTVVVQCVRELLFNVVRHTSAGEASVSLNRSNGVIKITVEDKGCGFDTKEISAPTDKGGFGLFNIQERIDMVGGEVDIESEPNKGTKATLYIPLKDSRDSFESLHPKTPKPQNPKTPKPQNPKTPKPQNPKTPREKIKILLADDHQMVRAGLRKIIEEQDDMTVIGEAADGEEAVKMSRDTSPDIVIMDVNMPKMDGIKATKKILSEMPRIRIIGLSLHDDEAVVRDMRKVGATAYLTKNEAFESLVLIIRAEASAT